MSENKEPRSPWANAMRRFGIIVMIILSILGFVIGAVWAVFTCPFSDDDFANIIPGGLIGLPIGGIIGVISMSIIMFFGEIGVNLRKTAENTQTNKKAFSNADELKKYKELFENKIITQEEYERKKQQLLDL